MAIPLFLAKTLLMCNEKTVKAVWPPDAARRKEARERTPCKTHSFNNMIVQYPSGVVEVDRFDADVRVEGVLVEENRTTSEVSHIKAFMKDSVVDVVRSFLQGDEVPLSRNLFFDSIFCVSSRSRIPVVNTKPPLLRRLRIEELVDS